ncbi:MAG: UDP-N-acetylmuramate dehydrogenase [Burkholderiaceae bacterium]|nr:UDP-N-acetylmuramate dehydrogenase [Burkholderiaceae bacterium]
MNLTAHNTLRIAARADQVLQIDSEAALAEISQQLGQQPRCILGSGSNVVLHAPIPATVLLSQIKGRHIRPQGVLVAGAGENWHEVVMWSLAQGYGGLENLALIPGTVGAAPVQNIGAYGVEISERLINLTAWDFQSRQLHTFSKAECGFAYRHSIFKDPALQGPWNQPRFFITQVQLQLAPIAKAEVNIGYGDLKAAFAGHSNPPSPMEVADAVMAIRRRKLPDPAEIGNVGSFFKNPIISNVQAKNLRLLHPDLPQYPLTDHGSDQCKISAAWLIERCGFKGARRGDVGVHQGHALVLVNHGDGTGREILALAHEIQQAVVARFGVFLEPEPVFMP